MTNSKISPLWIGVGLFLWFGLTACSSEDQATSNPNQHVKASESAHDMSAMDMDDSEPHDMSAANMEGSASHELTIMSGENDRSDVHLSTSAIQTIGVRYATALVESLSHSVRTTGRFAMDEQAEYEVTLKTSGYIENLQADYNGKRVEAGEPLFDLYSPELVATQEELLTATRYLERLQELSADEESTSQAIRVIDAVKRRLQLWDVTDDALAEMENGSEPLRTISFAAPVGGEIMGKQVAEGSFVKAGSPVMKIVDISKTWLVVDIYEQDVPWIEVGTPATVELPYNPGFIYEGVIDYIYPMLDANLKTAQARIILPSGDDSPFKPGMFATVTLEGRSENPSVTVPSEALLRDGEQEFIILSLGEGMFRPVRIRSGIESGGRVQVLDGLEGGETIVSSAQFLIDSEAQLGSAVSSMAGMEH